MRVMGCEFERIWSEPSAWGFWAARVWSEFERERRGVWGRLGFGE